MWHLRLRHERHCNFSLLSWITWSAGSQQSFCENTHSAIQKNLHSRELSPPVTIQPLPASHLHGPPAPLQMTAALNDILITTSWESVSQNHSFHLALSSWSMETMRDKCLLLLEAVTFWGSLWCSNRWLIQGWKEYFPSSFLQTCNKCFSLLFLFKGL